MHSKSTPTQLVSPMLRNVESGISQLLNNSVSQQLAKSDRLKQELEQKLGISYEQLGRRLMALPTLNAKESAEVNKTAHGLLEETKPKTRQVSIPANRILI